MKLALFHRDWFSVLASVAVCLSISTALIAQTATQSADESTVAKVSRAEKVSKRIRELVQTSQAGGKFITGLCVIDLRTQKQISNVRSDELFIPASNQKILTSAFSLCELGGDFNFATAVYALDGKLVIAGEGDPTFADPVIAAQKGQTIYHDLDSWSQAIKKHFNGKVPGSIIVRSQVPFDKFRNPDWPADQKQNWYCAPVSDVNFNNNCYDVSFRSAGRMVTPIIAPVSRFIKVTDKLRTARKHLWRISGSNDESSLVLSGTVKPLPLYAAQSVSASNPPMLFARVLADRLARAGVKVSGNAKIATAKEIDLSGAKLIAMKQTTMQTVLNRANKRSLNLAAECLFLRAGDGTWDGSAKKMTQTLVEKFKLDKKSFIVSDGGGLSRRNRITPEAMVKLLSAMLERPENESSIFLRSLPISGTDGTMRKRLTNSPYQGRVLAKTGVLNQVRCMSGYILDPDGKPAYAFSVLCNSVRDIHAARKLHEDVCKILVDEIKPNTKK